MSPPASQPVPDRQRSGGIVIRHVGPDDAALFGKVDADVFDDGIVPGRLAVYLRNPSHLMVVAIEGDVIVGQIAAVIHHHPDLPDDLYIDNLGVAPRLHRRGIGSRLLKAAFALGRARGCETAWVATETGNGPARALYRALGPVEDATVAYFQYDL